MSDLDDLTRLPDDFDGQVRLFPLPSLVLFPHAVQPLHIFEPRYCEMLSDALATDELIAMATLTDHVSGAIGQPPIAPTVCLGRIVSHVACDDDRHNILLVGIKRAQIATEIDAKRCFRIAKSNVLDDLYPPTGKATRRQLRAELLDAFGEVIPSTKSAKQELAELLTGSMGLGPITDIIAHTLPLPIPMKLDLLKEYNVDQRAEKLMGFLKSGAVALGLSKTGATGSSDANSETAGADDTPGGIRFPPPFSVN
ncbi:LON peptidase substrate-binding domain-containing protein [Rhodopirellula sp. MGV]|uniref:LON peptidase substrate-binding domain-containing protein n=1 Tax=Rhodopirellula sp. MGV TaxID=2023130 RepID=UPI000B962395|nr:LON peptidase substrate-binding domain-containing protein [Rhodopirellula sp. MGV]OYP39176.1 ATP-dependent protease [Rhodopirellula sp. MGV]PNY35447.1 ATP-dependent protease [Rhodopirellula baltica]